MGQIVDATAKGVVSTYKLEVERERNGSDRGGDRKGSRVDVLAGGGEGAQWVNRGGDCKGSRVDVLAGGGEGQIVEATAKELGSTYVLVLERGRNGSNRGGT